MINPESIDLAALPCVDLSNRVSLPSNSGVYFAIDAQGVVQYIGQTTCLMFRWKNHHKCKQLEEMGNVRISYLTIESHLLESVEKALLEWFQPPLNRLIGLRETSAVKCRLKDLMADKGLTQQQVAGETGLSPTIVGRLYHNRFSRLDNGTVETVCRFFGVELGEMFYIEKNKKESDKEK